MVINRKIHQYQEIVTISALESKIPQAENPLDLTFGDLAGEFDLLSIGIDPKANFFGIDNNPSYSTYTPSEKLQLSEEQIKAMNKFLNPTFNRHVGQVKVESERPILYHSNLFRSYF